MPPAAETIDIDDFIINYGMIQILVSSVRHIGNTYRGAHDQVLKLRIIQM